MATPRKKRARKVSNEGLPKIEIPDSELARKEFIVDVILNVQLTASLTVSAYTEDEVVKYDYREAGELVCDAVAAVAPLDVSCVEFCEVEDLAGVEEI